MKILKSFKTEENNYKIILNIMETSKIYGATLFVKKICSLNPKEYKYISLQLALEQYSRYVYESGYYSNGGAKNFNQWLKTEI